MIERPHVRLREHREAAGLTQLELAEKASVGIRTVNRIENVPWWMPNLETLHALAGALDVTVQDLLDDKAAT